MRIDLREIKTYVITTNPVRRAFVHRQLRSVGMFENVEYVEGVRCSPKIVGCGLSHLKVLMSEPKQPYLVLEDDVAVTEYFQPVIDVPSEACMVYLGVSVWGMVDNEPRGVEGATQATRFDENWLRVHNMFSTHAILYVSAFYDALAGRVLDTILDGFPFDAEFAWTQQHWTVLTPNNPFFYQSAEVGGAEDATRKSLLDIPGLVLDGGPSQGNELRSQVRADQRAFSLET